MKVVTRQLLRAIRGKRSQTAFSRRLGFRGNAVAAWEAGRRSPRASMFLQACNRVGIDTYQAFQRFHQSSADLVSTLSDQAIAMWLESLRGRTPIHELAARMGVSRYSVSRWLRGLAFPRLPEFLLLVEGMTGRVSDWVAELVPIAEVPALQEIHNRRLAAKNLAFEEPWTEVILRIFETTAYRNLAQHQEGYIAGVLGIDLLTEQRCIERMLCADVIHLDSNHLFIGESMTVHTQSTPEQTLKLKQHWNRVVLSRMELLREDDIFSYNVFSVSKSDRHKVREILLATYREIRALISDSKPSEVAGVFQIQLMNWE